MKTATKRLVVTAKAPDSRGVFTGVIHFNPPEGDADGERVANFTNVPGEVPLSYQHSLAGDPGAVIGVGKTSLIDDEHMRVDGRLDLKSKMAQAVHERMLLGDDDELVLKELSVGFVYDPAKTTRDDNGVTVIHDAELLEISVVYRGAQPTSITSIKALIADVKMGLITYEAALKYAEDLDMPADITEVMIRSALPATKESEAAPAAGNASLSVSEKSGYLSGSWEETERALVDAITAAEGSVVWVQLHGTFPTYTVATVEREGGVSETFRYEYSLDEDGKVVLGERTPVEVDLEVRERAKAGRVIGSKRVDELKITIGEAIDAWAAQVNGQEDVMDDKANAGTVSEANNVETKSVDPLIADLNLLIQTLSLD
jgi:hypothetical protein